VRMRLAEVVGLAGSERSERSELRGAIPDRAPPPTRHAAPLAPQPGTAHLGPRAPRPAAAYEFMENSR
jgi:hypothetical protein